MKYRASYIYDFATYKAQYRALRERGFNFSILFPCLLFIGIQAVPMLSQNKPITTEQIALELVIIPFAFFALFFSLWRFLVPRIGFSKCTVSGKKLDFTIDDEGLAFERDDGVKESWPWRSLKGITHLRDGSASVAWIAPNGGFVLPRAAFTSPDVYEAARVFMEGKFGGTGYKK